MKDCKDYQAAHTLTDSGITARGLPIHWHCTCGWTISGPKRDWYKLKIAALRHRTSATADDIRKAAYLETT